MRPHISLLALVLALPLLGACDPLTDDITPAERALEVVANNADETTCVASWDWLPPGSHDVLVVTEGSRAQVTLDGPGPPVAVEGRESSESVTFRPGEYVITCRYPGGSTGTTTVDVRAGDG